MTEMDVGALPICGIDDKLRATGRAYPNVRKQ